MKKVLVKVLEDVKDMFKLEEYEDDEYDFEDYDSSVTRYEGTYIEPDSDFNIVEVEDTYKPKTMAEVISDVRKRKEEEGNKMTPVRQRSIVEEELREEISKLEREVKSLNDKIIDISVAKNTEISNRDKIISDLNDRLERKNTAEKAEVNPDIINLQINKRNWEMNQNNCSIKCLLKEEHCETCDRQCNGKVSLENEVDLKVIDIGAMCILNKEQPKVSLISTKNIQDLVDCKTALVTSDNVCLIYDPNI